MDRLRIELRTGECKSPMIAIFTISPYINCTKGRIRTLANGFGDHHATVTSPMRICFVLRERLELSRPLQAIDPKSTVTTNSTTKVFNYFCSCLINLLIDFNDNLNLTFSFLNNSLLESNFPLIITLFSFTIFLYFLISTNIIIYPLSFLNFNSPI